LRILPQEADGAGGQQARDAVQEEGAQMQSWRKLRTGIALIVWFGMTTPAIGQQASSQTSSQTADDRQSLDGAWWTGPMLAPSAATLPQGHFVIEPYLYDVITVGQYDYDGVRRKAPESNGFGSLTYINYGLVNRFTVGVIPTFGYNRVSEGPSSSGVELGDVTVQGQFRLTQFHEGSWIPTISFAAQETLPSGRYDRLGDRPSNGLGAGAYTTTLALYSQTYFWLPNKRILRMRLNVSQSFPSEANVDGVSVYGTGTEFRGHAKPGETSYVDASWEYSLTRSWVLALDAPYRYQRNTRVSGYDMPDPVNTRRVHANTGYSDAIGFAPAVEYSWKSNIGVLLGTRIIAAGRNTAATVSPAIAINIVR